MLYDDPDPLLRHPVVLALVIGGILAGILDVTYGAITGGEQWAQDTFCAIVVWIAVIYGIFYWLYLRRIRKSARLIIMGISSIIVGALLFEVDAALNAGERMSSVILALTGVVEIGRGIFSRGSDKNRVTDTQPTRHDELQTM